MRPTKAYMADIRPPTYDITSKIVVLFLTTY